VRGPEGEALRQFMGIAKGKSMGIVNFSAGVTRSPRISRVLSGTSCGLSESHQI